jgi:hypothetical protein
MADEEIRQLLKKNIEVSEESLGLLKKMHRAAVIGRFFSFMKWVVIIGISVGSYYLIEPYIKKLTGTLNSVTSGINEISKTSDKIQNLLPR